MKLISSLVVIIALFWHALADVHIQPDGTLIARQRSISTEQLKMALDELQYRFGKSEINPIYEQVAQLLYSAEDQSAEVLNGLTVADLIEANKFQPLEDCTKEALEKRASIYFKTTPEKFAPLGAAYAVPVYLLKCFRMTTEYCVTHKDQVVEAGIEDDHWMDDLHEAYEWDNRDRINSKDPHNFVWWAHTSNVDLLFKRSIAARDKGNV